MNTTLDLSAPTPAVCLASPPSPLFTLLLTRTADKAQKKLDKPLRVLIRDALLRLLNAPFSLGEALKCPLTGTYSHHFTYQGKEYRIAYQVDEAAERLVVLLIGSHENFYRKLKQVLCG
jgi:mRNA interferase RelE/StbE